MSHYIVDQLKSTLGNQLKIVQQWLVNNRLSLHLGKTEAIVFGSKRRLNVCENFDIEYNGSVVKSVDKVKYLGVTIDQDLSGCSMANSVLGKINRGLKILYRKREFFKSYEKKLLCSTLLQAFFDYGNNVWYPSLCKLLNTKLQTSKNKMIRFVLDLGSRSHVGYYCFEQLKSSICKKNRLFEVMFYV